MTCGLSCRQRVRDLEKCLAQNIREDDGWTIHATDAPDGSEEEQISEVITYSSPSSQPLGFKPTENFVSADRDEIDPAVATGDPPTEYFVRSAPGAGG